MTSMLCMLVCIFSFLKFELVELLGERFQESMQSNHANRLFIQPWSF
jgi:hypothetical protein